MKTLIKVLENLMHSSIDVEFKRNLNQFQIVMKTTNDSNDRNITEQVILPFDHLNEDKIVKYLNLMHETIINKSKTSGDSKEVCGKCRHWLEEEHTINVCVNIKSPHCMSRTMNYHDSCNKFVEQDGEDN